MSDSDTSQPVCEEGDTYLPNPQAPDTFYECVEGVPSARADIQSGCRARSGV